MKLGALLFRTARSQAAARSRAAGEPLPPRRKASFLSAIVCPLTPFEIPTAIANLELWETRYPPTREGEPAAERPKLVFSFSGPPSAEIVERFTAAYADKPRVQAGFSGLEVHFCDLPPEKDLYVRNPTGPSPKYGFKSGPNWQFYETMKALRPGGGFAFLMETDCRPLSPGWVSEIQTVARHHRDAWIVGAHYSGMSPLHWSLARHINGNALYNVGDDEFWEFLDGFFWDWMHDYIRTIDPNLAYDCAWETFINRAELENSEHDHWHVIRRVLHRFQLSEFIVNIGGRAEQGGYYVWSRRDIRRRAPSAVVVHGPVSSAEDVESDPIGIGKAILTGDAGWTAGGPVTSGLPSPVSAFERSVWLRGGALEIGDQVQVRMTIKGGGDDFLTLDVRDANARRFAIKRFHGEGHEQYAESRGFTCKVHHATPYLRLKLRFKGQEAFEIGQFQVTLIRNGRKLCERRSLLEAFEL